VSDESSASERPTLRIVRGDPDTVELAAIVAVVAASASASQAGSPPRSRSAWADPHRTVRAPLPTGGWRASSSPR
jgi:hypothetical protein